ncbi:MAG: DUF1540 domain-containing protein [Peptococcaceae bacterium]|nr:DUF1540 domain-containing protein [Peptococcaceae bacterium]
MNQHIHCIVNDCHYWSQGNRCAANEILVSTDEFGASQQDRIDATMAKQLTPASAGTCMATCCKTYIPKNSDRATAEGVTRMS